jgi:hypothetical protein
MHNRQLTEISRRAGELAIIWLKAVMKNQSEAGSYEEWSEDEVATSVT